MASKNRNVLGFTFSRLPQELQRRGPQDRVTINVNEEWEVRYWSKELGLSSDELRQAVKAVGSNVTSVNKHVAKATGPYNAFPEVLHGEEILQLDMPSIPGFRIQTSAPNLEKTATPSNLDDVIAKLKARKSNLG